MLSPETRQEIEYWCWKHQTLVGTLKLLAWRPLWWRRMGPCGGNCVRSIPTRKQITLMNVHYKHREQKITTRRSLSIDGKENRGTNMWKIFKKRQATANQSKSLLFSKLPPEVRRMIYEYVLCEDGPLYILQDYFGLRLIRYGKPADRTEEVGYRTNQYSFLHHHHDDENFLYMEYYFQARECRGNPLALLQTCRRM